MSDRAGMAGRLRARRDVSIVSSGDGWVVKDPLTLEYFRLGHRERFLLAELSEPLSIAELTRRYREAFPNEQSTAQQVLAFCSSMKSCSLLVSDRPRDAGGTRSGGMAGGWTQVLLSPLAIRLPGVDPTPLLRATGWMGAALFSWWFVALLALAGVVVGIGLIGEAEALAREASRLIDLFDARHTAAAILALAVTKTWHELGHAMACRRLGAECHEVGVMLLAFTPCLYCDASDAWTLSSRWKRAVVALAGVYFEAMLAIVAAAAWLVLAPGPMRVLALYVVVIASVSTFLVNLNPLLRFDGYYLLADVWGVSNLHAASRAALWGPLTRWLRDDRSTPDEHEAAPALLAMYGAASLAYGYFILGVILWFVHQALEAAGFRAVGDALVVLSLVGIVMGMIKALGRVWPRDPSSPRGRVAMRGGLLVLGFVGVAAFVLSIEVEQTLRSPCRLESVRSANIVAPVQGLLTPVVAHGQSVRAGDLLAKLEDPEARLRGAELAEREATLAAELAGLETRAQTNPDLLSDAARLRPQLREARRQLAAHRRRVGLQELRTPIAGNVLPPARRVASGSVNADGDLPTWTGTPLEDANRACLLAAGETLCRIADSETRAVVLLDQDDSGLLRLGTPVRLILDRDPGEVLTGRVQTIAQATTPADVAEAEARLEATMQDPLRQTEAYRVVVALDRQSPCCQPGALGVARLETGQETLGAWCLRRLRRLVRFG